MTGPFTGRARKPSLTGIAVALTASLLAMVPTAGPAEAQGGRHNLVVRVTWEVNSVAVAIVRQGYRCVRLSPPGSEYTRWASTGLVFADGTVLRVNKYTGPNCDGTYWGGARVRVPSDQLSNFWLDMAR